MKEESGVRISEFLDGELSDKELNSLMRDLQQSENKQQLKNFSRIGHALRGESDVYSSIDVSDSVASAIAQLKPEQSQSVMPEKSTGRFFASAWFKPALGAAFASVVAMLTIVVNQSVSIDGVSPGVPAVAQQQIQQPKNIELTAFARSSDAQKSGVQKTDMAAREELNNYLVNHSRSASGGNYQGMVPYVRAVAYEQGQTK